MGAREVSVFLSDLATRGNVSASTQNQALAALLFLISKRSGHILVGVGTGVTSPLLELGEVPAVWCTALPRQNVRAAHW